MEFLVDAQLPPSLARYLRAEFGVAARHVADLELGTAADSTIAEIAAQRGMVVVSKDEDFLRLARNGRIPGLVYVTCGNVTNSVLTSIFQATFAEVLRLLRAGEAIVEIGS